MMRHYGVMIVPSLLTHLIHFLSPILGKAIFIVSKNYFPKPFLNIIRQLRFKDILGLSMEKQNAFMKLVKKIVRSDWLKKRYDCVPLLYILIFWKGTSSPIVVHTVMP